MNSMTIEILIILGMILFNGFFSMSEMAVVSSRKSRLKQQADEGKKGYATALKIAETPGSFLSTIQTGITLIGILSGAFGGATLAESLSSLFIQIPLLAPYSEILGIGSVVLAITFCSIVLGELVPKRLALSHPEAIASKVVGIVHFISYIFLPIVKLLTLTTELILRMFGIKKTKEDPITEEEITLLMEQGKSYGLFHESEQDMVERVLYLKKKKPFTYMVPRLDIDFFDLNDTDEVMHDLILNSDLEYLPVCKGELDEITGVINIHRALKAIARGEKPNLRSFIEEPLFIPQSMNALSVLERFKNSKMTIAFVIDEFGGVMGMASLDDVLSEVVGESIQTESESGIKERADGSFLVDGIVSIEDFQEKFEIDFDDATLGEAHTVAGLLLNLMDKIPVEGEICTIGALSLEVIDMDANRIDKILVTVKANVENIDLLT